MHFAIFWKKLKLDLANRPVVAMSFVGEQCRGLEQGILVQWGYSVWHCNGEYKTLSICQHV